MGRMTESDADEEREFLRALIRGKRPVESDGSDLDDAKVTEDGDDEEEADFEEVVKFYNPSRGREMFRCTLCPDKGPFKTKDDAERFMTSKFYAKKLVQVIASAKKEHRQRKLQAAGATVIETPSIEETTLKPPFESAVGGHARREISRESMERKNSQHKSESCRACGKAEPDFPGDHSRSDAVIGNDDG